MHKGKQVKAWLANHPRFNPNVPDAASTASIRNRAALDSFEPGSTMKSFVVAAALEEKAIKPDEAFSRFAAA